jgi:hypothetical protein
LRAASSSGEKIKMRETTNLCPHCGGTGKRLVIMPRPILGAGSPRLHEALRAGEDLLATESSSDKTASEFAKIIRKPKRSEFECK